MTDTKLQQYFCSTVIIVARHYSVTLQKKYIIKKRGLYVWINLF